MRKQHEIRAVMRHLAITGAIALQLCAQTALGDDAAAHLVARAAEKNAAFMNGDMERWSQLVRLASDFTLMEPLGGPASHGFDMSPARMAKRSQYFRNSETELEVAQTYSSDEMIVLVMIERQQGEVGGLPKQDWSLRVTEVYRKEGSEWTLVHRHADPLVHKLTIDQAAPLARGLPGNE